MSERDEEIIERYKRGESPSKIGEAMGIQRATVYRHLRTSEKYGMVERNKNGNWSRNMKLVKSKIDYIDLSANSMYGCKHGCPYCYMETKVIPRMRGNTVDQHFKWTEPEYHFDKIPRIAYKPFDRFVSKNPYLPPGQATVAVNFTGDMFGDWVPREYIEKVLEAIPDHNQLLFLTKNPRRYEEFAGYFKPNCWLGTTVEGKESKERLLILNDISELYFGMEKRPKFWVSFEPLLSDPQDVVDVLGNWTSWIVVGACTGQIPSQPKEEWVVKIYGRCLEKYIPMYAKSNLESRRFQMIKEFPRI